MAARKEPPLKSERVEPLSKEQATADTLRALRECYPDRWERVWAALERESAADKSARELASAAVANPSRALAALAGAAIGAALSSIGDQVAPSTASPRRGRK